MNRQDVIRELKAVTARYESQKEAADHLGVSPQYLNDVVRHRREPGPKLLKALHLRRVEAYERTGK